MQRPVVLVLLTQKSKNEMNINTDVYITLWKESNEDYSAFLKLYANSVHIAGLFLKMDLKLFFQVF